VVAAKARTIRRRVSGNTYFPENQGADVSATPTRVVPSLANTGVRLPDVLRCEPGPGA
jgi:hypothetical protein